MIPGLCAHAGSVIVSGFEWVKNLPPHVFRADGGIFPRHFGHAAALIETLSIRVLPAKLCAEIAEVGPGLGLVRSGLAIAEMAHACRDLGV